MGPAAGCRVARRSRSPSVFSGWHSALIIIQSSSTWALESPGPREAPVLAPLRRFIKCLKPLASTDIYMNPSNVLEHLRGFDRTSPQFHKCLSNFFRSEGYRSAVPSLQGEDLAWLVEYLDSVSFQIISLESASNAVAVGSRVCPKSPESRVPGISARAEKYMRHQRDLTENVHGFKFPPGHRRAPVSFWIRA